MLKKLQMLDKVQTPHRKSRELNLQLMMLKAKAAEVDVCFYKHSNECLVTIKIAEGGFNLLTPGLWVQHASAAPLCANLLFIHLFLTHMYS